MILKKNIFKKRLKGPDEFVTQSEMIIGWFADNWKFILSCTLLVIVAFFLSYTYAKNKTGKERTAYTAFYKGLSAYQKMKTDASGGKKDIRSLFDTVEKDFSGTRGARYAQLYKGHTYYAEGNFEKAVETYKGVLGASSEKNIPSLIAKEGLGYSYFALKKYQEAVDIFNKMITSDSVLSKRATYLTLVDIYLEMNDNVAAENTLKKIIDEFPDDPENDHVKNRLATLIE